MSHGSPFTYRDCEWSVPCHGEWLGAAWHCQDREDWLRLFDRVATRSNWRVFSWALLSNHFHLFLRTREPTLSAGMHDLNSGYASLFNR